jgi:hypothetical protein
MITTYLLNGSFSNSGLEQIEVFFLGWLVISVGKVLLSLFSSRKTFLLSYLAYSFISSFIENSIEVPLPYFDCKFIFSPSFSTYFYSQ